MPPAFRLAIVRSLATALLSAPAGRHEIREAARLARRIRGLRFPQALAVQKSLSACQAMHDGRTEEASKLWLEAAAHFDEESISADAAACRYRSAHISGGHAGAAAMRAAEEALRARGVACPARWVQMVAPAVATHRLPA